MRYFKIKILMLVAGITLCSCDRDELFNREQYKKMFALLSADGFNIFAEEHDLKLAESPGFVSAVCGGSLPTETDINITMVEDGDLLLQYNRSNFDVDESKYARWLPREKYDIDSYSITIKAGESIGLMPVTVHPSGLSPDSIYFIPLRADRFTAYELNPDKSSVLYRVFLKNYYATNRTDTYYSYRGKRNDVNVMGSKRVFPVSGNSVRIMAGDITFEPKVNVINSGSVLLTVDENDSVRIESWKGLEVTRVNGDPDYPNTFLIYDDGYKTYKTFLLRYDYVYDGTKHSMREELRLEFREENE
ncbi:MAG: DUF4361 domain-containing protein [Prevotellaceae bacterium]|jgi:hypothetical protein|nr:DUF4361 domain-containing protein [Prevotellaceae bacterium]